VHEKIFNKFGDGTRVVATIGDSTFFHTGISSLIDAVYNKSNAIVCILDNRTTRHDGTAGQPGHRNTLQGEPTKNIDIETVVRALVSNMSASSIRWILRKVRQALTWAFELDEVSVIITEMAVHIEEA